MEFMNYRVLNLKTNEKPDVQATVEMGEKRLKIGVEHTDYYVDTKPGESSPGKQLASTWRQVQTSIRRRISHRPILQHITGLVAFKRNRSLPLRHANDLAKELVQLAQDYSVNHSGERTITKFLSNFPLLNAYISKVILIKTDCRNVSWECINVNASSIGVSADEISLIVSQKAPKSFKYCRAQLDELWLVITASASTIFQSTGPCADLVYWESPPLEAACRSTAFDRIFFWDRIYNWYQ